MSQVIRPILTRTLLRERLFKCLDEVRKSAAVWISGPSGCGKATLLYTYLDSRKIPCVWHEMNESDGDPATFFYHLSRAERAGAGAGAPLPFLTPEYLPGLRTYSTRFFADLFGRFPSPGVIVLQGYDELPAESPIHEIIGGAFSAVPEGAHFILLSRSRPPANLTRTAPDAKLQMVGWDQLRLSADETGEVARLRAGKNLGKKEVAALHKASDGLAVNVILLSACGRFDEGTMKSSGEPDAEELFRKAAGEIFERAGREEKQFLLKTSFLTQMTLRMAGEITGYSSPDRFLPLLSGPAFLAEEYPYPEPVYRIHLLWRKFLAARAKELFSDAEVFELRRTAGRLLEASDRVEDAAALYFEARDWDSYMRVVIDQAEALLAQGRSRTLFRYIERIPPDLIENIPALMFYQGACLRSADPEAALACYQKAFCLFQARGDIPFSYVTAADIMTTLVDQQSDCALLTPWLDWTTEQIRVNPHFFSREVEAKVAAALAAALLIARPQHPDLKKWLERSLKLCREVNDRDLHIRTLLNAVHWCQWTGDMTPCSVLTEQMEKITPSFSASPALMILKKWIEACILNIGPAADFEAARQRAKEGMEISEKTGVLVFLPMLRNVAVVACLKKGELDAAGSLLKEMGSTLRGTKRLSSCRYHYLSAWHHLLRGDYSYALFDSKAALNLALEIGAPAHEILCRLEMADIMKAAGETKNAAAQLESCRELLPQAGSLILEYLYLLAKARLSLEEEEEAAGLSFLKSALALGRSQGFVALHNCWEPPVMARLCALALAQGTEVSYVRTLIRKRSITPDAFGQTLENWPWPLKIYTLGQFRLEKDGKRLIFPGKAPQKALLMLKALIALGGRDVREEQITDSLWPDSEGDTAHMGFKTLLSRVRQLLGIKDVIAFQGGKTSFNPEICWLDTWAFEELHNQAKKAWEDRRGLSNPDKAIRLTDAAFDIYRGNFLTCDATLEWTSAQRDRLRRKFHFLTNRLGEHLQESKKWKEAVERYEKAIEVDPSSEEFYQNLMTCYLQLDRPNEGVAVYRRLRKIISAASDIAISRKTEAIYQSLLSSQTLAKRPV